MDHSSCSNPVNKQESDTFSPISEMIFDKYISILSIAVVQKGYEQNQMGVIPVSHLN